MLLKERFKSLKEACSRTIQTSGADTCCAGRITVDAREKDELAATMHQFRTKLQVCLMTQKTRELNTSSSVTTLYDCS